MPKGFPVPLGVRRRAVELVAGGESLSAAARAVGSNHVSVRKWCRLAGVATPPRAEHPPELRRRAVELVAGGESCLAAARGLGVSAEAVRRWCHAAGVKVARPGRPDWDRHPPELRRRAVELVAGGLSISAAARELGVSWHSVSRWCHAEAA